MPNEEYEIAKKERARKAKLGMLSFLVMLAALVAGIVFIALTIP
jgi:predicted nucleic acid-binding Zn ribbon protein